MWVWKWWFSLSIFCTFKNKYIYFFNFSINHIQYPFCCSDYLILGHLHPFDKPPLFSNFFPYFLTQQHNQALFCIFPVLILELAVSPRSASLFQYEMIFRSPDLGTRCTHCTLSCLLGLFKRQCFHRLKMLDLCHAINCIFPQCVIFILLSIRYFIVI